MKLSWQIARPGQSLIGTRVRLVISRVSVPAKPGSTKPAVAWTMSPRRPIELLPSMRATMSSGSAEVGMHRWYGPAGMATDRIGLFGPDTVTWRVNREAVLLAGGGRALLLQVAHPLVAAGVVEHSRYEADPWGRLYRTLDLTTKIFFGDAAMSGEASRRLRARHAVVRGVAPDGRRYE